MTLKEMAAEYRMSGELCRTRIRELNEKLRTEKMCEMEKLRLRRRILLLETMLRDTMATAAYLENYYGDDKNERKESVLQAG